MARAARVASLPESLFWDLTPGEVDEILREAMEEWQARDRAAMFNAAMICATLANCHRDPKKKPEPFSPADWMPAAPPPPKPELTAAQVAAKGRAAMGGLQKLFP